MISDVIAFLLEANLALAVAVLLVLALRKPVRAAFGARSAYALWLIVPLAILALLIPARTIVLPAAAIKPGVAAVAAEAPSPTPTPVLNPIPRPLRIPPVGEILAGLWVAVAFGAMVVQAERQRKSVV